jgi:TetR/AcrR family fatty acid metabolism transcriptional regulator
MERNPDSARIFLSQLRQSTSMIKMVVKRSSRAYKDIIEGILEQGMREGLCRHMNVRSASSMLFGAYQSLVLDWVADDCSYALAEQAEELTDFVLKGVCCTPDH